MNKIQYQTIEHHSQDTIDRQVSRIEPTNVFRSFLAALAFTVSGILFVLYPAIRPFSDESSLQGALAFASSSWVLAHSLAMLGFILLALGLLGLYLRLQATSVERTALWALVLSWIGVGLTLPYYGAEVFGLHAIGQEALRQQNPGLLSLVNAVRWEQGIVFILAGLSLLAVGTILFAIAIWRSGILLRWSGIPLAIGFALYIPQFTTSQFVRVGHGLFILLACLVLAWSMMASWNNRTEKGGDRSSISQASGIGGILRSMTLSAFITTIFGTLWALGSVLGLQGLGGVLPYIVLCSIALALFVVTIRLLTMVRRLPAGPAPLSDKKRRRLYIAINVLQMVAIVLDFIVAGRLHHPEYSIPILAAIVGLHFFGIAPVFNSMRYYVVGGLFCLLALFTVLLLPVNATIGPYTVNLWWVVVGGSCALILWVVTIETLTRSNALVQQSGSKLITASTSRS
jgi:hypothetical protein